MTEAAKPKGAKPETLRPDRMLLARERNVGFTSRRVFSDENARAERLAGAMAGRAGLASANAAVGQLLKSALGEPSDAEPSDFAMDEFESPGDGVPIGFADLVRPLSPREFFARQYRRRGPMLFRGPPDRFSPLMGWDDLNEIIEARNLKPPQLQVVSEGQTFPATDLFSRRYGLGWRPLYPAGERIDGHSLTRLLQNRATLLISSIGTVHEPINALIAAIEASLGTHASANLYVSYRNQRGFTTHWDSHDVYVLQVRGCKDWRLFGEVRPAPTEADVAPNLLPPPRPVWTGTIKSGDLLFIPRGWWHDARIPEEREGEGSIHLTMQLQQYTGRDVLIWLATKLAAGSELFRSNVPIHAGPEAADAYRNDLARLVDEAWRQFTVESFADDMRAAWSEDTSVHLDQRIDSWTRPDWDAHRIVVRGARQATLRPGPDASSFRLVANGFTYRFDSRCRPLVTAMLADGVCVGDLKRIDPQRFPASFVDGFLATLLGANTVRTAPPESA
ncbi:MAG: hypothetical protein OXC70_09740 [Gammaproteobacteria bacterium]|nr:hypothetical protein [Gammaproteobacteria bacterium]